DEAETGLGVVEGSVFALFGLLLAFTFAAGQGRFESRRVLASDEANAIGTAYLRLDLLPASAQPALPDLFRTYTDSRMEFYRTIRDLKAADAARARSNAVQAQIWSAAVAACLAEPRDTARTMLVLEAINPMIDITTSRLYAARTHTPTLVFVLLY